MPRASYFRLSPRDKEVYRLSDRISAIWLDDPAELQGHVRAVKEALDEGVREAVQAATSALCTELTSQLRLPAVEVEILEIRPCNENGELHGLYEWEDGAPPRILLWMLTAKRRRVVAFKTFLRTLIHEICHHVDFSLLRLPHSFHTDGFFKRESSLYRQLLKVAG